MSAGKRGPGRPSLLDANWPFLLEMQELIDRDGLPANAAAARIVKCHRRALRNRGSPGSTQAWFKLHQRRYADRLRQHLKNERPLSEAAEAAERFEHAMRPGRAAAARFERAIHRGRIGLIRRGVPRQLLE